MTSNWSHAVGKPDCPTCGSNRQVEHIAGLVWVCACSGNTFTAKPVAPAGLHPRERL